MEAEGKRRGARWRTRLHGARGEDRGAGRPVSAQGAKGEDWPREAYGARECGEGGGEERGGERMPVAVKEGGVGEGEEETPERSTEAR